MSDFEKTTESKVEELAHISIFQDGVNNPTYERANTGYRQGVRDGRNSAKESLEILAMALTASSCRCIREWSREDRTVGNGGGGGRVRNKCERCKGIAAVKQRGDWPL